MFTRRYKSNSGTRTKVVLKINILKSLNNHLHLGVAYWNNPRGPESGRQVLYYFDSGAPSGYDRSPEFSFQTDEAGHQSGVDN